MLLQLPIAQHGKGILSFDGSKSDVDDFRLKMDPTGGKGGIQLFHATMQAKHDHGLSKRAI